MMFSLALTTTVYMLAATAAPATDRDDGARPPTPRTTAPTSDHDSRHALDLGTIRYLDPTGPRTLWLGLDTGGIFLPEQLIANFGRDIYSARVALPWALAVARWLSVGGRHELAWYDAENIQAQYSNHEVQLSIRPTAFRAVPRVARDRLSIGFEAHTLFKTRITNPDGSEAVFRLGGLYDRVLSLGYGMSHDVGTRLAFDWNVQGRYVWVFVNRQRQFRSSLRMRWMPRDGHTLSLEATAFVVFRDEIQAGNFLPQVSPVGQGAAQYDWMSRKGVGLYVRAWFSSSFLSGTAPVYEVREEAINQPYGELAGGLRVTF